MAEGASANENREGGASAPPTGSASGTTSTNGVKGAPAAAKPSVRPRPRPTPSAAASEEPSGSFEVGYGKPPRHTRFKPGQSGNPKGRPKGSKNTATIAREQLDQLISVKVNGVTKRQTARQVAIQQLVKRALEKGDIKAFHTVLALAGEPVPTFGGSGRNPGPEHGLQPEISPAELGILAFAQRQCLEGAGLEPEMIERVLAAMGLVSGTSGAPEGEEQ